MTTSFTAEQRREVNIVLAGLVEHVSTTLNRESPRITALDKRPKKVRTEEQPDVFLPYVNQGMLEDLIEQLQELV